MHDMRRISALMIVLLGFVIAVAPVATAVAQPGGSPAAPQSAPANPSGATGASDAPAMPPSGNDAKADNPPANPAPERVTDTPAPRNEAATAPAASPRTEAGETTRIFGLPVLVAALIAGALLLAGVLIIASARRAPVDHVEPRRDRLP